MIDVLWIYLSIGELCWLAMSKAFIATMIERNASFTKMLAITAAMIAGWPLHGVFAVRYFRGRI